MFFLLILYIHHETLGSGMPSQRLLVAVPERRKSIVGSGVGNQMLIGQNSLVTTSSMTPSNHRGGGRKYNLTMCPEGRGGPEIFDEYH